MLDHTIPMTAGSGMLFFFIEAIQPSACCLYNSRSVCADSVTKDSGVLLWQHAFPESLPENSGAFFFFNKAEVLSEEPILKWYKDVHVAKGKSVFLEQMEKFVEWLKNAEEESESEAEEGDWILKLHPQ